MNFLFVILFVNSDKKYPKKRRLRGESVLISLLRNLFSKTKTTDDPLPILRISPLLRAAPLVRARNNVIVSTDVKNIRLNRYKRQQSKRLRGWGSKGREELQPPAPCGVLVTLLLMTKSRINNHSHKLNNHQMSGVKYIKEIFHFQLSALSRIQKQKRYCKRSIHLRSFPIERQKD